MAEKAEAQWWVILEVGRLEISGGYYFSQTRLQTVDCIVN